MLRLALDTNVLVYAEEVERSAVGDKAAAAIRLVERLRHASLAPFVAVQCLAELHRVLVRKRRMSPAQASSAIEVWRAFGQAIGTDEEFFETALELASDHQLQIYDFDHLRRRRPRPLRPVIIRRHAGRLLMARRHRRQPVRAHP